MTYPLNDSWITESNFSTKNGGSPLDVAETLAVQLSHSILGAVGFIENIVVVAVVLKKRITLLGIPSNRFVLNLALADVVACLATISAVACITTGRKYNIFCNIIQFALLVSVGNLLLLTFNRFLSVYTSLRYPALMTTERAKGLQVASWIIAVIFSVLAPLLKQAGFSFMLYARNAFYTVNILIIFAFNVYLLKQARDKRKISTCNAGPVGKLLFKRDFRLVIRLLILNLIFFGSCVPLMIIFHIYSSQESRQSASYVRKVVWCYFAVLLNAVANPFVYGVKLPIFQRWIEKRKQLRARVAPKNLPHATAAVINIHHITK